MELSKKELIAMQEMMNFVSPTTKEEALLKKSIYDKISAVVGTPESRKAEQEKAERMAAGGPAAPDSAPCGGGANHLYSIDLGNICRNFKKRVYKCKNI